MSNENLAVDSARTHLLENDPWDHLPDILNRISAPSFASIEYSLVDFGAHPDGATDCTDAFRKAIGACHMAGGGRVIVPPGDWLTGAIRLKTGVELHVTEGATIKFKRAPQAYLPLVHTRWEGTEVFNYSPFIYAMNESNIAITGKGFLDGQADGLHWWSWDKIIRGKGEESARKLLHEMNDTGVSLSERVFGEGSYLRPNLITFFRCRDILIEDVTLLRSPMWHLHPLESENVTVRRLTIESSGPNTDGCNPESCKNVLIEGCNFNTGNDCIAIKSGRNSDGRRLNIPSQNIVIRGCRMKGGHGAITLGSEITGGVRNVFVENCFMGSATLRSAIRVKNNSIRGGLLEKLYCRRIFVDEVCTSILEMDFNYEEGGAGNFIPCARTVQISQLVANRCTRIADVQGAQNGSISNVKMKDCYISNVAELHRIECGSIIQLENVFVDGAYVHAL